MSNLIPEARIYETEAPQLEAVGLDHSVPPLKRNQDGQIDFDYYLRRGRAERSTAAVTMFRRIGALLKGLAQRQSKDDANRNVRRQISHYV